MEEEDQKRPLLIAAGIALVVALPFVVVQDASRCEWRLDLDDQHRTTSSSATDRSADRSFRLWLDAGELHAPLREAIGDQLERAEPEAKLTEERSRGRIMVRVDDASLYTPGYANARLVATMTFETAPSVAGAPAATGEARVVLEGTCYGVVSQRGFREKTAAMLAKPLVQVITSALHKLEPRS